MRKLAQILLIFFIALVMQAQTKTNSLSVQQPPGGLQLKWTGISVDSAETIWSQDVRLGGYNSDSLFYYVRCDSGTAGDSIAASIYVYANYIYPDSLSDWFVIDTLVSFTVDSASADTTLHGTANLNLIRAPYNKIRLNSDAGGKDFILNFGAYIKKE